MHRVVKWETLEFIRPGGTNKCILLFDLLQYFIEFFVMYETERPCVNGMQNVQREGIELCAIFR